MKRTLSLSLAMMLLPCAVIAATVEITGISGAWSNVTGATASGEGTNVISWGTPATSAGQSSYEFNAEAVPFDVVTVPFNIGEFVHNNNAIFPPSITGAQLTVDVVGNVDGAAFSMGGTYQFTHDETTNAAPCLPGSVSICDDVVSLGATIEQTGSVTVDGLEYFLSLTGFEGGSLNFLTQEGQSNSAMLQATFSTTRVDPVPLPAGILFLGTALAGLGVMRKRSKAA